MEFVHHCHFCGWQREADSPTILQPHCQRCGCLLSSGRPADLATEGAVELPFARGATVPPRLAGRMRAAAFLGVLFTAAATGLQTGGPWMALGAIGATGLAVTPVLVRG